LGSGNQQTNILRGNLGLLYENIGKYDLAKEYHVTALKNFPVTDVWNHPHFATCMHPYHYLKYQPIKFPAMTDAFDYENKPVPQLTEEEIANKTASEQKLAENLTEWDKNRLQQQEEARLDLSMTLEIIKCQEHYLGKNHFKSAPVLFFFGVSLPEVGSI